MSREELYKKILDRHPAWTYDDVAEMTPHQQQCSLRGKNETADTITFDTDEDYQRWMTERTSR